ncbi:MAG: maleylpyruvate isomerase N-terminal domain-containing protein [Chloroflexi bacterium]|nr:maleylpyruvate isomerase N-terminal domain-containing protein [Chloroflexota bacterium]
MTQRLSLVERIELAYRTWNEALAGLNDSDFQRMVYRHWTLKDVFGHVFAYLDLALQHVKSFQKRKRLASTRAPSYAFFNRREAEQLRSISLAQLRTDFDATFRDLMVLVPTLGPDDLKKRFPSQWTKSKYTTTLRNQLRETAGHMQNHADEVKAWRKTLKV